MSKTGSTSVPTGKPLPTVAVLSGGGIKGLAFAPAFKLLEDAGIYNNISLVIGSSVGGLTAAMLAFGFNARQLEEYLTTGGEGLMDIFSTPELFSPIGGVTTALGSLMGTGGAAKGHALYHAAQAAVADALGDPDATFADLQKMLGKASPTGGMYRDLEVTVTVKDARGSYQIVCGSRTTPNMPIALAMRMTASLPIAFPPVKLTVDEIISFTNGATEPLVKYTRENQPKKLFQDPPIPFPPFVPETFYDENYSDLQRQQVIDAIRDDLIENSFVDGELICTDGGVVDNLPIYLSENGVDSGLENTIALDFEEPWKKNLRETNSKLYAKDLLIKPIDEKFYTDTILNPAWNDKAYYLIQNNVHESRIPPSHQLALLQKGSLLSFDIDDISAADFDLKDEFEIVKNTNITTPKTHDDKVSYLLKNGYEAGKKYLNAQGLEPKKSFFEMYPSEEEKSIKRNGQPLQSIRSQIATDENRLENLENMLSLLEKHTNGEFHQSESILYSDILKMRIHLQKAKELNLKRETAEHKMSLLINHTIDFTKKNIKFLLETKKECDKLFFQVADKLDFFEKNHFQSLVKNKETLDQLREAKPQLADKFEQLIKYQETSMLLEEMLSLIRSEAVVAGSKRTKPMATLYKTTKENSRAQNSTQKGKKLEEDRPKEEVKDKPTSKKS